MLKIELFNIMFIIVHVQDKSKLLSYVVASGLTYGAGENLFHFLFKVLSLY
jgi:hypothetical protein